MHKIKMLFVLVAAILAVTTNASAQVTAADVLRCVNETKTKPDGTTVVVEMQLVCAREGTDAAGNPTYTIQTSSEGWVLRSNCPAGADLACLPREDILAQQRVRRQAAIAAERRECREAGGEWIDGECVYPTPLPPTPTPGTTAPPLDCPPVPLPPPPGGSCTADELQRIADGLQAIESRLGQISVLAAEEINELRAEAENLREQANGCHEANLAERATVFIAALEPPPPPPPHDYHDEFERVHQHLDELALGSTAEEEENWCLDTVEGVFTCIVLPVTLGAIAIGVGGALLYDYCDDDSADQVRTFY